MQLCGGNNPDNAAQCLKADDSQVIITSHAFREGKVQWDFVDQLVRAVCGTHLVLASSCRIVADDIYVVCVDRWETMTDAVPNEVSLQRFAQCCDELLVHAVDVQAKKEARGSYALPTYGVRGHWLYWKRYDKE